MNQAKKKHPKRKILNSAEIANFIDVWRQYIKDLRGNKRNVHILEKMKKDLADCYKINLEVGEIRTRINNLTKKFRDEIAKRGKSGGSPSDWEYFDVLNEFLGSFKCNRMTELMEESLVLEHGEDFNYDEVVELEEIFMESPYSPEPSTSSSSSAAAALSQVSATASSSSSAAESSPVLVPRCGSMSLSGSTSTPKTRIKRSISERFLELAEKESEVFTRFCEKAQEANEAQIKLMEENNRQQNMLLEYLLKKGGGK